MTRLSPWAPDADKPSPLAACFRSHTVRFSHRSARDFLLRSKTRYEDVCASWPGFENEDPYGRIYLAQLLYGFNPAAATSIIWYIKFPFANISKCGPSKGLNILSNHCFMPLGKNSENSGVGFQHFKSACPRHFYSTLHIVG